MAQPFGVDAVADPGENAIRPKPERGKPWRCLEQRLRRDQIVLVAVDQQHRRARFDLGGEGFEVAVPGTTSRPE